MTQVTRKGPRVKSNLLFNRRKPGGVLGGRNKFAGKILSTTPATTTTTTESSRDGEEAPTTEADQETEEENGEKRPNIASRFKPSNRRPFGGVRPGGNNSFDNFRSDFQLRTWIPTTAYLLHQRPTGEEEITRWKEGCQGGGGGEGGGGGRQRGRSRCDNSCTSCH